MRELKEIKTLRKKFLLTQKELALRAGVSQSLIAKIEAESIEPTYGNTVRIFKALEELRIKEEVKAKEIMNKSVHFAQITDSLKDIVKVMKNKGISQMPVLSKERVCGLISESTLLKCVLEEGERFCFYHVGDVMEEAPPIVSLNMGIKTIPQLLQNYPIVLVAEKGEIKGVITKTDLLGRME